MTYTPRTDNRTGANCTAAPGNVGRTITLQHSDAINAGMFVKVQGVDLDPTTEFTMTDDVVTLNVYVEDSYSVIIRYYTQETVATGTTSVYTDTLQVVRTCGIGIEVFDELVGTGNSSQNSFDLDNGNVIAGSYELNYGASGSNSLNTLIETTHYVLSKDEGRILLTAAGVTILSTNVLYASYMYSPKMSDTLISTFLPAVDKEVEKKTGNYWSTSTSETELFDGRNTIYPTTDEPFATDWDEPDFVTLKYRGVIAITSVKFLTRGGSVVSEETLNSYDYFIDVGKSSKLTFLNRRLPNGTKNIQVIYTHGYDTVDPQIKELAAMMCGLRVFANITGGSFDDATGYQLGRKQVQIGEVYVNVREVTRQFETRIQSILSDVGEKYWVG